jgi:FkbM family methyltransferase
MLSYAQLCEDVYIQRCFSSVNCGFYIDIGASHLVVSNSSYHFYQQGWHGISVQPTPFRLEELKRTRPRDLNPGVAIGRADEHAPFNSYTNADHLSSLYDIDAKVLQNHLAQIARRSVEVMSLATLCDRYAPPEIHFLRIDVEGSEGDVIEGANWRKWRPHLLIIEAVLPGTGAPAWSSWETHLLAQGYQVAFFDGVNRCYVAIENSQLAQFFRAPANPFDGATQLHSFGHVLDDRRHPDHEWARNYFDRISAAATTESDEHLFKLMTWDLLDSELSARTTDQSIQHCPARSPRSPLMKTKQ